MHRAFAAARLGGIDRAALGLPSERDYVERYCERRGIARIGNWTFHLAFSFFRFAAICQGVYRRALDGNASNPEKAQALQRCGEASHCARRRTYRRGRLAENALRGADGPGDRRDGRFRPAAVRSAGRRRRAPRAFRPRCRPAGTDWQPRCRSRAPCSPAISREETLSENLVSLAVKRFGGLDIAINNAGIAQSYVRLPQVPSDEARRIIDIDLMGVFYAMKHQLPQMERQYRQTRQGRRHRQHRLGRRAGRRATSFGLCRGQACRRRPDALGRRRIRDQGHSRQRRLPGLRAHRHGRRFREDDRQERGRSHRRADARRADEAGCRGRRGGRGDPVRRRPEELVHDRPCAGCRRRHRCG